MSKTKLFLIFLATVVTIGAGGFYFYSTNQAPGPKPTEQKTEADQAPKPTAEAIPLSFDLAVPYSVQAPFANWTVHEESCEEAAVAMYEDFLLGKKDDIPAAEADKRFREMKTWQTKNYGHEPDLSMEALGKFANSYYGQNYRIIEGITAEKIKEEVVSGRPVIVPVMTHSLKNPHYNTEDSYHVLLIKGYDQTGVLANDAGIRQGKNWHYSWEILFSAIDAQKIDSGRVGLVFVK